MHILKNGINMQKKNRFGLIASQFLTTLFLQQAVVLLAYIVLKHTCISKQKNRKQQEKHHGIQRDTSMLHIPSIGQSSNPVRLLV